MSTGNKLIIIALCCALFIVGALGGYAFSQERQKTVEVVCITASTSTPSEGEQQYGVDCGNES